MLPLNYAIYKLFEKGQEPLSVREVMDRLRSEYGNFRAFKESFVNEALMCGEVNGILDEATYKMDKGKLYIYYLANDEGREVISKNIKG
jgi:hypothetical protein